MAKLTFQRGGGVFATVAAHTIPETETQFILTH